MKEKKFDYFGLFLEKNRLEERGSAATIEFQDWNDAWKGYHNYFFRIAQLAKEMGKQHVELTHKTSGKPALIVSAAACDRLQPTTYIREENAMLSELSESDLRELLQTDPAIFYQNPFFTGLVEKKLLKVQEKILNSEKPTFLASLEFHRNIAFNKAGMELLNSTPLQMLKRNLPSLWVPPGQHQPINYDKHLPPYLIEFLTLLKQQSRLPAHRYWGYKSNGDGIPERGEWVADIEVVDVNGHPARMMVDLDWIPAKV